MHSIDIMYIPCYFGTMKTIRVSATNARNNFFQLLNQVIYEDSQVIIGKAGTDRQVVLSPQESKEKEHKETMRILDETFGIWRNVPLSHFKDDRMHGKKAKAFLNKLRKGNV